MSRFRPRGATVRSALACWTLTLGALLVPPWAFGQNSAQQVDRVKVEVEVAGEGLLGELKTNINTLLQIEARRKDDLRESELRQLHEDAEEEIRLALEPFGYYRPVVRSTLEQDGDDWTARYEVEPGPRMQVAEATVRVTGPGADEPTLQAAREGFPLQAGSDLYHPAYEGGKQALVDAASSAGYLDATFPVAELQIDLKAYSAKVDLAFETGPQYLFGEARFVQDVLDPDLLEGYITYERGTPLDLDVLLKLQNAISDSPYFQRVEVIARRDYAEDLEVPIIIELVPAAAQKWDFGIGYGTDTGPRGTVELDQRRFNRRGHRGEAEFTLSEIETSFGARYLIPGAYPRTDVLTFTAGYAELTPDTSTSETALLGVGRTQSRGRWREAVGLHFERTDFSVGVDEGISELLIPEANWSRVKADDRLYPLSGLRFEFGFRGAEESLLSDSTFFQVTTETKAVRALGEWVRAIGRVRLGRTWTSDFRDLPPSIRFFAGGDRSVRGYGYQELGPLDEEGNVIGGEALLSASLEIDSLFLDLGKAGRWGGAVFYDIGGAGDDLGDGLESGAGAGLRWLSPIGLVRLDAAWALDEADTPVRFHVMIGPDL